MPFTFSHPAAVLPLRFGRLSFSAMVVGSMAPDFLYFMLLSHTSRYGHTLPGMFFFSLPVGIVVLWLFHRLFKGPLLALAPDHLVRRISPSDLTYPFGPASRFGWIAFSVLLGVITHVIWDNFTHESGLFVTIAPELRLYFGVHMPLYAFLQLGSTVVGFLFLVGAYWRWARRTPLQPQPAVRQMSLGARVVLLVICTAIMMAFALRYGAHWAALFPSVWWSVFIVKTVIAAITAGFVELFVFSLIWILQKHNAPEPKLRG